MDEGTLKLLDCLDGAADRGDRDVTAILPTFGRWFAKLQQDPIANQFEPGSVGHTTRMFALRQAAEAVAAHPVAPSPRPAEPR